MMTLVKVSFLLLLVVSHSVSFASDDIINNNSNPYLRGMDAPKNDDNNQNHRRTKQTKPCVLLLKVIRKDNHTEEQAVECELSDEDTQRNSGKRYARIGNKKGGNDATQRYFLEGFLNGAIVSGVSTLIVQDEDSIVNQDDDDGLEILIQDWDNVESNTDMHYQENGRHRHLTRSSGTKQLLAVRVVASDTATSMEESFISDRWFGTNGDTVTARSIYDQCSYSKLIMDPANKVTTTGVAISNGVYTVHINRRAKNKPESKIKDAVIAQLENELGSLNGQFDHVILCLPRGTNGNWLAYAYINHHMSVFNDDECNFVSGQVHEIGHNIGLAHSGEGGDEYDDQSGMMGYSYSNGNWPVICFNAVKNWKLNWYNDQQLQVPSSGWSGRIYGIVDYGSDGSGIVILQLSGNKENYYISFNRAIRINRDSQEAKDKVLVHKRSVDTGYAESWLLAKLSAGSVYTGGPMSITVNEINLTSSPAYAYVTIGDPPSPVTQAPVPIQPTTPSPTNAPVTPDPTSAPITLAPVPDSTNVCSNTNCNLCYGGGECKKSGCRWIKGLCYA